MGEIIDMQQYRLQKSRRLLREAQQKRLPLTTAREIKNRRDAAILQHPAGRGEKGRHE